MDASHNIPLNKQVGRLNRLIVWHGTCSRLFVCDRTELFLNYSELFPKLSRAISKQNRSFPKHSGLFPEYWSRVASKIFKNISEVPRTISKTISGFQGISKICVGVFPKYQVAQVSKSHPAWVRLEDCFIVSNCFIVHVQVTHWIVFLDDHCCLLIQPQT